MGKVGNSRTSEAKAREIDLFVRFFAEHGVSFRKWVGTIKASQDGPEERGTLITVAQAHFHFDADGRFLGTESDEMGRFSERTTA